MAIQLAAAIAPVVKKVGIEIATEVAYKMWHEEPRRRKAKINQLRENGGLGTSMDAPKPDMKQRVKNFGNRVAYEVLDSKALNTGIGAVVGSISTAVSSNIRTPEEEVLFKKKEEAQKAERPATFQRDREAQENSKGKGLHR